MKDTGCQRPYPAYYALCFTVTNDCSVVSDSEGKDVSKTRNTKMYESMLLRRKEVGRESEIPTLCLKNASGKKLNMGNVTSISMNKYCLCNTFWIGYSRE